ncbi:hypothetical protein MFIFM68171_00976 [Madurella fahalii]|uniref:RING-type domain-containing protein n=1 Tax=Madurella fahalii TaxID=1157608 RepID=A0ABQ0FZ37_9PEZI
MCILLIRNFQCPGALDPHQCKYMLRCSTPSVYRNAEKYEGALDFPCMESLDTRTEWYDEACPACTGEISVPKTNPTKVVTTPHHDVAIPARDYAFCMATWLFVCIYENITEDSSYHVPNPIANATVGTARTSWIRDDVFLERQIMVLSELMCQVRPEHGSLTELTVVLPEPRSGNQLDFSVERNERCDCLATQQPYLTNWATDIRRRAAAVAYFNMMTGLNFFDLMLAFGNQEVFFREHQKIQTRILDKNLSYQSRFPVPDMLRVSGEEVAHRTQVLAEDIAKLNAEYLAQIPREHASKGETARHEARASLLQWVKIILARDSGITLKRARIILEWFANKVVKYDPDWAAFVPAPGSSTWKRLAYFANACPYDTGRWVGYTTQVLGEGAYPERKMEGLCSDWEKEDRARAAIVQNNVVAASEAEIAELEHAECLVCLSEFKDHTTVFKTPVRNPHCGSEHSRHWVSLPCIVKAARTLQGSDLTPRTPECPACRTKFEPEDDSGNAKGSSG